MPLVSLPLRLLSLHSLMVPLLISGRRQVADKNRRIEYEGARILLASALTLARASSSVFVSTHIIVMDDPQLEKWFSFSSLNI